MDITTLLSEQHAEIKLAMPVFGPADRIRAIAARTMVAAPPALAGLAVVIVAARKVVRAVA